MSHPRILIACVGNIFLGDDSFGVEVARRLMCHHLPEGIRVVDFGIRGLDLTYALLDDYESVILVDAVPRGGQPGTLYVIEPEQADQPDQPGPGLIDVHGMDPVKVLRLARAMGAPARRLLVVGCEPAPTGDAEDMQMGLSEPVRAAVDEAVGLVTVLATRLLEGEGIEANEEVRTQEREVGTCRDS